MTSQSFDTPAFRRLRLLLVFSLVLGVLGPLYLVNRSTFASSITSASFSGGAGTYTDSSVTPNKVDPFLT